MRGGRDGGAAPDGLKTLGVIGGMGPAASALFYETVIARTQARRDQEHIPILLWSHSSMPDRTEALRSGRGEALYSLLLNDARMLVRNGAGVIAIPCNTSHTFADRLAGALPVPLVNMIDAAAEQAAARGMRRVGILATDGTLQNGLYQSACAKKGLVPVVPEGDVQRRSMFIIYDRIKAGLPARASDFAEIEDWLRQTGCDGAVLGCTEFSVARLQVPLSDQYVDAMLAMAERAIRLCGGVLKE